MLHDVRIVIQCHHSDWPEELQELHNNAWSDTVQQAEFSTEEHHDVSVQDDASQMILKINVYLINKANITLDWRGESKA